MIDLALRRRNLLLLLSSLLAPRLAFGFGEEGAFHARLLDSGSQKLDVELTATRRWALELTRRTSAPGKLASFSIAAKSAELLEEPFLVWVGSQDPGALDQRAIRGLRQYLRMGGMLLIDDRAPRLEGGAFLSGATREIARVLPEATPIQLDKSHVVFKSFYILEAPQGRVNGPDYVKAIVSGNNVQVLFLNHDLLGALARDGETWAFKMESGDAVAREYAIRFAVNIAMYVLCSDYKDDQVHAPFLMRRRQER